MRRKIVLIENLEGLCRQGETIAPAMRQDVTTTVPPVGMAGLEQQAKTGLVALLEAMGSCLSHTFPRKTVTLTQALQHKTFKTFGG